MQEFEIVKQLEYLIAFQNECLNKSDFENFDKAENAIKQLEEALVDKSKQENLEKNEKLKNILHSLESVSRY